MENDMEKGNDGNNPADGISRKRAERRAKIESIKARIDKSKKMIEARRAKINVAKEVKP